MSTTGGIPKPNKAAMFGAHQMKELASSIKAAKVGTPGEPINSYESAVPKSVAIQICSEARALKSNQGAYQLLYDAFYYPSTSHVQVIEGTSSFKILKSGDYRVDLRGHLWVPSTVNGTISLGLNDPQVAELATWQTTSSNKKIDLNSFTILPLKQGEIVTVIFEPSTHEHLKDGDLILSASSRIAITEV